MFVWVGLLLSLVFLYVTEDEYFKGPPDDGLDDGFLPVYVSWHDVGCEVAGKKHVLRGISGDAAPGRLTAILGASGSGKTTLAHALLGRSRARCAATSGMVSLNGEVGSLDAFNDRVGFVPQDDVLHAHLTVEETLMYAASWRLPRHLSEEKRRARVNETIAVLGLDDVRHSLVGSVKDRRLSGGQRKRTSIGMELVARPSVLVLDEPTSGLDGAAAFRLVRTLSEIAQDGVSIVTVVHQPSTRIFKLFDDLVLLQHGRLAYFGARERVSEFLTPELLVGSPSVQLDQEEQMVDVLTDVVSGFGLANLSDVFERSSFYRAQLARVADTEDVFRNSSFGHPDSHDVCERIKTGLVQVACKALVGMVNKPQYSQRPRPGIIQQVVTNFRLYMLLQWRRGVLIECIAVVCLAVVSSFVRIFNLVWARKPLGAFYISVCISNLGMIGAVMEDDVLPVRRALDSGMLIGSHEFALLFVCIVKSIFVTQLFAITYFTCLYVFHPINAVQPRAWCVKPFRLLTYFHFTHLISLEYNAARALGLLLSIVAGHNVRNALVIVIWNLMAVHCFSLFTPTYNQIVKDGVWILGRINIAPVVLFQCSFSYVRYFIEAMVLWDPDHEDKVGRQYVFNYYGYKEGNEASTTLATFSITVSLYTTWGVSFSVLNANSFSASYDIPQFIFFLTKIVAIYIVTLLMGIIFIEYPRLNAAWMKRRQHVA